MLMGTMAWHEGSIRIWGDDALYALCEYKEQAKSYKKDFSKQNTKVNFLICWLII
jgi:hypothetical protein